LRKVGIAAASVFYIGGCASFEGAIAPSLPIDKVIDHIQCELLAAYREELPGHRWLKDWVAGFSLSLQKDDESKITPGADYLAPIPAGRIGIGVDLELKGKTRRTLTVKRTLLLKDFDNVSRVDRFVQDHCSQARAGNTPLLGDIGLREALRDALESRDASDFLGEKPETLGYRAEFTLAYSVSGGPSWTLRRFTGLGFGLSANRETVHTLDFAFSDNSPKPTPKVEVINFPAGFGKGGASTSSSGGKQRQGVESRKMYSGERITPNARFNLESTFQQLQLQGLQRSLEIPLR